MVPGYLLRPLNLDQKSNLYGIYYPTPEEYLEGGLVKHESHDFVFSPIQFRSWPFVAYLTVRLKERVGVVADFSRLLDSLGINILLSNCHRSGHRHFSWSVYIDFQEIRNTRYTEVANAHGEESRSKIRKIVNSEIEGAIEKLRDKIIKHDKGLKEKKKLLYKKPFLHIVQITSLEGHYWMARKIKEKNRDFIKKGKIVSSKMKASADHFYCKIDMENRIIPETLEFSSILREINGADSLPTFGLAHVRTEAAQIRFSVIPRKSMDVYQRLLIEYALIQKGETSKGLLGKIGKFLQERKYNMRTVSSQTWNSGTQLERGSVEIVLENVGGTQTSRAEWGVLKDELTDHLQEFQNLEIIIRPVQPYRVFLSMPSQFEGREEMKELCLDVCEDVGIILNRESYRSEEEGVTVAEQNRTSVKEVVIERLRQCDGVLQFFMEKDSENQSDPHSIWLEAEYLAASTLRKPVVRITDEKIRPVIATEHHPLKWSQNKDEQRRIMKDALVQLITAMKKKKEYHLSL